MTGRGTRTEAAPEWGPRKLMALLVGAVLTGLLLLLGLGLAVVQSLRPSRPAAAAGPRTSAPAIADQASQPAGPGSIGAVTPGVAGHVGAPPVGDAAGETTTAAVTAAQRDALAAKPMPVVDLAASRPGAVSARDPGTIVVPTSTTIGSAGVPSGFPRTPEGALGQLAAIDQAAMQSGSLAGVRAVIAEWAAPGGPTPESWSAVHAMAEFLEAAGLSGGGTEKLSLVVTPQMGLIKGSVGSDFVVPCVDFEFVATIKQTQRVAAADCQRMLWLDGRWVIGPGAEPAPAPSVWPGTETAINVGYKDLRRG